MSYDKNGNITNLQRNGKIGSSFGAIDNLSYTYSGNRLTSVTDGVSGNHEVDLVPRNGGAYTYHADGSLKSDANEQTQNIVYDTFLKQPKEIQLSDGRKIKHFYDGFGKLLKTEYYDASNTLTETWEFMGNLILRNDVVFQLNTTDGRAILEQPVAGSGNDAVWRFENDYKDHLGNTRVSFKDSSGHLVKTAETAFDPWGVRLNGVGSVNGFQNRWEFQNKEKESTFGLNRVNFGARTYNATIGRFDRVDALANHPQQLRFSSYVFSNNNPVNLIDPDGRYPRPIIKYNYVTGNYNFTAPASHLLSLVSGVNRQTIESTVIQERKIGQYRPFYSAYDGGGAITIGTTDRKTITYTENFFADNKNSYDGHGYGRNLKAWLDISSHEVGHLPQIDKAGGLLSYVGEFIGQYSQAGEHDGAPNEIEAERGAINYRGFSNYVNSEHGNNSLVNLFSNSKITDEKKIERITQWWNSYQETQKKQNEQNNGSN